MPIEAGGESNMWSILLPALVKGQVGVFPLASRRAGLSSMGM